MDKSKRPPAKGHDRLFFLAVFLAVCAFGWFLATHGAEVAALMRYGSWGVFPVDNTTVLPLAPPLSVASYYGSRMDPFSGDPSAHSGIDLNAPEGTPVFASKRGNVEDMGYAENGSGNFIELQHPDGSYTRYAHMSSFAPGIVMGASVLAGETIGFVGSTGRSTGPHLHYEVLDSGRRPVDPAESLGITNKGNWLTSLGR